MWKLVVEECAEWRWVINNLFFRFHFDLLHFTRQAVRPFVYQPVSSGSQQHCRICQQIRILLES
jgi:hypothetical protein